MKEILEFLLPGSGAETATYALVYFLWRLERRVTIIETLQGLRKNTRVKHG